MLVLSRHHNQSIIATHPDGTKITFTIVDIRGDKVRIGITAPLNVSVHRQEVQESIERHGPRTLNTKE